MAFFDFINLGGPINWVLFCILCFTICLCLERAIYFFQTKKNSPKNQLSRLESKLAEKKFSTDDEKKQFIQKETTYLHAEMSRGLWILNFISAVAPSIGLLGTVTGLIKSFQGMANSGSQFNLQDLSGGIWEAMLTTAFGMIISIPSMFFYRLFKRIIEKRITKISLYAEKDSWTEGKKNA